MNKEKIVLEKFESSYWPKSHQDELLLTLWFLFREDSYFIGRIKEEISEKNRGFTGNAIDVDLRDDIAYIRPLYGDENEQLQISKNQLIQLIDDWLELIEKYPDEIIISRDEHGTIALEGVFKDKPEIPKD